MAWFRRSDGLMFEADEGTATFDLLKRDGSFERVEDAVVAAEPTPEPVVAAEPTPKPKPAPRTRKRK